MPSRHAVDGRRRLRSANTLAHSVAGRNINSAHATRRPRSGCGQSIERSTADDHDLAVAAGVPLTTKTLFFQSVHKYYTALLTNVVRSPPYKDSKL